MADDDEARRRAGLAEAFQAIVLRKWTGDERGVLDDVAEAVRAVLAFHDYHVLGGPHDPTGLSAVRRGSLVEVTFDETDLEALAIEDEAGIASGETLDGHATVPPERPATWSDLDRKSLAWLAGLN